MDSIFGRNVANVDETSFNTIADDYIFASSLETAEEEGMKALFAVRNFAPVVPLFNYRWLSVYSEHNLENWVNDTIGGAIDLWNPISITPKSGSPSELVVAVLSSYFDEFFTSLNPFRSELEIDQESARKHWETLLGLKRQEFGISVTPSSSVSTTTVIPTRSETF